MTHLQNKRDFRRSELLKEIGISQADREQGSNAVKKIFRSLGSAVSIPFPRREIAWEKTSEGRRHRIRLLPQNPFFIVDVGTAREWLGIPDDLFEATDAARQLVNHPGDSEDSDPGQRRDKESEPIAGIKFVESRSSEIPLPDAAIQNDLLVRFTRAYTRILEGIGAESSATKRLGVDIDDSARRAASAFETDRTQPDWIEGSADPITCVVEALLYRYRLPWWVSSVVTRSLLIGNTDGLADLPADLASASRVDYDYQHDGFDVTVHGIDEFMDLKKWTGLYEQTVKPIIDSFLEARGSSLKPKVGTPKGGYTQYIGVLGEYVKGSRSLGSVISTHFELDRDQRTIERRVRELEALLKPRGPSEN